MAVESIEDFEIWKKAKALWTIDELKNIMRLEEELQRMLNGLIKYLLKSNRKDRHTGRRKHEEKKETKD